MNERKTSSMLQRVPVILAVTAASYGLQLPPQVARTGQAATSSARAPGTAAGAHVLPGTPDATRRTA